MGLSIAVDEPRHKTKRLLLEGSLDTDTASQLDRELETVLATDLDVVVLDLGQLEYISSAGLRVIFKLRKAVKARSGEIYATNLQPQVKKVFDIVKAMPLGSLFASVEELDRYLDTIQRRETEA